MYLEPWAEKWGPEGGSGYGQLSGDDLTIAIVDIPTFLNTSQTVNVILLLAGENIYRTISDNLVK